MSDLSGRLRYLRNAEAFFAVALPAALIVAWTDAGRPIAWPWRAAGLALVSALLLQGALYWHLKLAAMAAGSAMPPWFAALYTTLRRANLVAFAVYATALAVAWSAGVPRVDLGWSAALLGFAVLEHVNYYHWQLMYDSGDAFRAAWRRRGLRRAALAVDLRRAQAAGTHRRGPAG